MYQMEEWRKGYKVMRRGGEEERWETEGNGG